MARADRQRAIRYEQSARPRMTSFTPVNRMQAPVQFISPQKTLHERDIFDIVEPPEEVVYVPTPISKKRGRAQSKGRAVSVDPLWEYVDEGDLASHNNGDDFETTFPKRRKPASAKRSKSMKSTPNTLPLLWPNDDNQPTLNETDPPTSQLTTPPDSGNAKKKRASSAKARPSKPKMGPFKAPTITKPAVSKQKEVIEESVQAKPITYLGHTTTQQTVMLSQTTLDRLASFLYIPPATLPSSETSTNMYHNTQPQSKLEARAFSEADEGLFDEETEQNSMPEDHTLHESMGYGSYSQPVEGGAISDLHEHYAPSNDAVLDATWNVHTNSQPRSIGLAEADRGLLSSLVTELSPGVLDLSSQLQLRPKDEARSMIKQCNQPTQQHQVTPNIELHETAAQMQYARSSFEDESEFREARTLPSVDTPNNDQTVPGDVEPFPELRSLSQDQTTNYQDMPGTSTVMLLDAIGTESSDLQQEQSSSQVLPALNPAYHPYPVKPNHVQVERSDIDDVVVENGDMSKDYDIDEFDEGLNDSDLVELVSEQIVLATQSDPLEEQRSNDHASDLQQQQPDEYHDAKHDQASVPDVLTPETDDEFALDDDMEDEMMHFDFEVVERCQPPASVQLTSDGCSTRGEVYDNRLQFSSPNRVAVSPNQQTNIDSAVQSPSAVPELSMDDAEDWSFISSQTGSNPSRRPLVAADPAIASPRGIEEATEAFPLKMHVVLGSSMRRQESASQLTTASIRTILDDSHEYEPLRPFARPDFPSLIRDRSPVVGLSPQTFLRVCFRVAEMLKEGARRNALQENAIIELFARVTHSSRESGTSEQHFQFADLWHDRPPFPSGLLANYRTPDLLQTESKVFIGAGEAKMARCFGRLKRDAQSSTGWLLDIISIRTTDWEEIRWTKRIVSAGLFKSEK